MLLMPFVIQAKVTPQVADSISQILAEGENCATCGYYDAEHSVAGMVNTLIIAALVIVGGIWLYVSKKKWYILLLAILVSGAVAGSYFAAPYLFKDSSKVPENCPVVETKSGNPDVFSAPGSEFESATPTDTVKNDTTKTIATTSSNTDEFSQSSSSTVSDEFSQASSDEFSNASTSDEFSQSTTELKEEPRKINKTMIIEPAIIFLILGLIGYLIKFEWFRKTRSFFLIGSLIYLGFVRGACPCMISSYQNTVLMLFGVKVAWESLLWFLLLIPATYFFGKVWCGWLCHLGALQEFIHRTSKLNFLAGRKAQKVLKIVQISVVVIWILQMLITRTNIFCEYDPFKVAFNLLSVNWLGWFFLVILIISSLLMHRPFCRTMCPVGLVLGWTSLLPGAKKLDKNDSCINCKLCHAECATRAMIFEDKLTTLNNEDCIMCGECMSSCKSKDALHVKRKWFKKSTATTILLVLFTIGSVSAQWECPSRLGATLKPIGNSNLMWSSELTTSGGFIGDYKIANAMLFVGLDYSVNHHTFYLEGGVKNWLRSDSVPYLNGNVDYNSQFLKFGMREAFYRYSDDKNKLTFGLQSTKSDDYFLINERVVGANYKGTFGNFNLNVLGGSVLKQNSRNGTFCTTGYLINVVPGRERVLLGQKIGQTNVSMVSLTYSPSEKNKSEFSSDEFSNDEFSNDNTASKKNLFKLKEIGGLAYYEFGSLVTATPFITGLYSSIDMVGLNFKPEILYQAATNNNAILYNAELSKDVDWKSGQLTKIFTKYVGITEISQDAVALNSYSNVFAGEVLRLDAMELPFLQAGIKHSFPKIKASVKLQAAMQTGKITGYIDDNDGNNATSPTAMKEVDLSFSKNFGKHFLVNAYVGYLQHPTLTLDNHILSYKPDSSPWGKVEIRLTF